MIDGTTFWVVVVGLLLVCCVLFYFGAAAAERANNAEQLLRWEREEHAVSHRTVEDLQDQLDAACSARVDAKKKYFKLLDSIRKLANEPEDCER